MSSAKISVIIVNYQSADLTLKCVNSLGAYCSKVFKIVIVDNSPDSEVVILEKNLPDAIILRQEENCGYASGVNFALKKADLSSSEYILLLNPDTCCTDDFLSIMKDFLDTHPEVTALCPKILKPDQTVWYAGGTLSILKGGPKHLSSSDNTEARKVDFLTACCLLIRKKDFIAIGGLPEKYFLYFEDAELSVKIKKHGGTLTYIPSAHIYHHVSATTKYASNNYVRLFARNRIIFMKDNFTSVQYYLFIFLHLIIRTPMATLFFLFRGELSNIHAYLKGLIQGLSYKSKLL